MSLILTLPYCVKDSALLRKNLEWMRTLQDDYRPHSCLLVADLAVPHDEKLALQALAKPLFEYTETIIVQVPEEKQKWPLGPNLMFATAARQIAEAYKLPWLWFEPDGVPIMRGWLDFIAKAYSRSPKRYLGSLVTSDGQSDMPPVHLAGCAVYPPDAIRGLEPFTSGVMAFDIAAALHTVPRAQHCEAMQHFWGQPELAPTFKESRTVIDPPNVLTLSFLKSTSVMFHRCKDGTLIDLLIEKANSRPSSHRPRKAVPARTVSEAVTS